MIPREIELQKYISDVLSIFFDISPFSVFYTECGENVQISLTLFGKDDVEEFLDLLGYKKLCDKSGFSIFYDKNTIVLKGMAKDLLFNLLGTVLKNENN